MMTEKTADFNKSDRKLRQTKDRKYLDDVEHFSLDDLSRLFHLPARDAQFELRMNERAFLQLYCRFNIIYWPFCRVNLVFFF